MDKDNILFDISNFDFVKPLRGGDCPTLCLGEMFPSKKLYYRSYLKGYNLCIKKLYDSLLDTEIPLVDKDTMAYPFIFLCRQTIELYVKYMILVLGAEYPKTHKLGSIYEVMSCKIKSIYPDENVKMH